MIVVDFAELCRGATDRLRQKGDADLLKTGKLKSSRAAVVVSVRTRVGLHAPYMLAGSIAVHDVSDKDILLRNAFRIASTRA